VIGFTAGLHSVEVLVSDFKYMADKAFKVAQTGKITSEIEWIPNLDITTRILSCSARKTAYSGHHGMSGLRDGAVVRTVANAMGKNTVLVENIGWGPGMPLRAWGV